MSELVRNVTLVQELLLEKKIKIKDKVMTGIKSVVVTNINSEGTYVGVPAKKLKITTKTLVK